MSTGRSAAAVAVLLGAAACRDAAAAGADEVAAELRAMRLALAARSEGNSSDSEALRGQLAALAVAQRASEARQADLQRDLVAWMQAVAGDASARRAEEAKQLQQRLDDLEGALRQQRDRHMELESMLLQGLDRAAQRVDGMLERLDAGGAAPAGGSSAPAGAVPAATNDAPVESAPKPAAGQPVRGATAVPDAARPAAPPGATRRAPPVAAASGAEAQARFGASAGVLPVAQALWFGLAAVGALSACWWIRREVLASRDERRAAGVDGVPSDRIAVFEQLAAVASGPSTSPPAPSTFPASPAPRHVDALGPPERLAGASVDAARWLAVLAAEPAVLREPPPQAGAGNGGSEVRFWLRPGTSAAARARLRLRLLRPGG